MQPIRHSLQNRRQNILLAFMLEMLHLSIWLDFGSPLSRSLMLVHLGLFLIWQPVWKGDQKLAWHNGLVFFILTIAFVIWMNWLLLFFWLILLIGFCGGRASTQRTERYVNLIVLVFLVSELLMTCTVSLFEIEIPKPVSGTFRLILPFVPLAIVLFPGRTPTRSSYNVDFIQATATAMLISLLVIGSLLNMYRSGAEYLTALSQTLIAIGFLLFVISWLLTPHTGFSGLSQLWMRSILNIGTPLEKWLEQIASLFEQLDEPEDFLGAAVEELITLPWVTGATWKTVKTDGSVGELTKYTTEIRTDNLVLGINSDAPVGGALFLHCKLLVQVIDNFYEAKLREKKLTQQAHLQAIYETGARVTHDIKNLLQSLHAITSITSQSADSDSNSVSRKLVEKQLPHLTQRLQSALDKLQAPEQAAQNNVGLKDWWEDLMARNSQTDIEFQADISGEALVPAELFDSVIENLLENIRAKRQVEPGIRVSINLFSAPGSIVLTVCDDGKQIEPEVAQSLLKDPVKSDNGLGIGLFQVAKQARSSNYMLSLLKNQDGRVCFVLKNQPAADKSLTAGSG